MAAYDISADDQAELIGQIIDIFEDFLEENNIRLNSYQIDKDGDTVFICGEEYDYLADKIRETLRNWHLL